MLKEEANKLAPVWLSMDQLLIEKNEKNEVRSIHSHSRRKSPSLNELLESVAQEKPLSSNETRKPFQSSLILDQLVFLRQIEKQEGVNWLGICLVTQIC